MALNLCEIISGLAARPNRGETLQTLAHAPITNAPINLGNFVFEIYCRQVEINRWKVFHTHANFAPYCPITAFISREATAWNMAASISRSSQCVAANFEWCARLHQIWQLYSCSLTVLFGKIIFSFSEMQF